MFGPVVAGIASGRPEAEADDEREGKVGPAHSSREASEQSGLGCGGVGGAKGTGPGRDSDGDIPVLTRPVMRGCTSFHSNQTGRQGLRRRDCGHDHRIAAAGLDRLPGFGRYQQRTRLAYRSAMRGHRSRKGQRSSRRPTLQATIRLMYDEGYAEQGRHSSECQKSRRPNRRLAAPGRATTAYPSPQRTASVLVGVGGSTK